MFAKLLEFDGIGQALFTIQNGDEGPEIVIRIAERHGTEPQITLSGWTDDEAGWDRAEKTFEAITPEDAEAQAREVASSVDQLFARANHPHRARRAGA